MSQGTNISEANPEALLEEREIGEPLGQNKSYVLFISKQFFQSISISKQIFTNFC